MLYVELAIFWSDFNVTDLFGVNINGQKIKPEIQDLQSDFSLKVKLLPQSQDPIWISVRKSTHYSKIKYQTVTSM